MQARGMALLISLCVLIVVLAGCATTPGALPSGKTEAGEGTGATAGEQTVQSADCPVTTPITITPPDSKYRDPLPRGAYYASADEMVLVPAEEWGQGSRKILWIKPLGSRLTVQGRRLDGDAAPLWANIPIGYAGDFQASTVIIPTAGCWEIVARANESELRFVLVIAPPPEPMRAPSCAGIDDVVRLDNVIVVGHVEKREPDPSGRWAWQSVRVMKNLYPYSLLWESASIGDVLPVLQDGQQEPLLAEGSDYLLVLHDDPWQIVCPQQTVAAVDFTQDPALIVPLVPEKSLWSAKTVPESEVQIRLAHLS